MNLGHLNALVRERVNDSVLPYLWSDDTIRIYLNEAVTEAAIRARLIFDEGSTACTVPVASGQAVYTLDPSIFEVIDAWWYPTSAPNNGWQLQGVSQSSLDQQAMDPGRRSQFSSERYFYQTSYPFWLGNNWRTWTGDPRYFIQDQSRFQLVAIPQVTGNVQLSVFRTPMDVEEMDSLEDEPVIPARWHARLIDWVLYRLFSDKDADTFDPQRSQLGAQEFENSFGKRPDANVERKRNQRTRRTVSCMWP